MRDKMRIQILGKIWLPN